MKPTFQLNTGRGPRLPKTDYRYHASGMGDRCFGSRRPSFRAISQDYFQNEARPAFVAEAALFSVIVMTAAVSVISSTSGLVHLVRSFGAL
jgi:hypothetical protein